MELNPLEQHRERAKQKIERLTKELNESTNETGEITSRLEKAKKFLSDLSHLEYSNGVNKSSEK